MLRFVFPLLIGLGGAGCLASLGMWQLERLAWKEEILADISARISAAPVALPTAPDPEADRYLPVQVTGQAGEGELHVLVSQKRLGAGFRLIAPFQTDGGRRILLDLGFVPVAAKDTPRTPFGGTVRGNLHWPDERDRFTPDNDPDENYWFARDVEVMAAALGTEPILVVRAASEPDLPGIQPLPVSTDGIPNSHLGYAVQWFGLAAVWLAMTGFFLWRRTRPER